MFIASPLFIYPEARDKRVPDYIFMTRLLSIFQDLHFGIRNNNRNRVDNRTLDTFMAGTERG